MKISPAHLAECRSSRGESFVAAVLAVARHSGKDLEIDVREWYRLVRMHRPPPATGLGDLVAAVATPIARVLNLPCIDPATKQLRPDSGCARRKAALNRVLPKI